MAALLFQTISLSNLRSSTLRVHGMCFKCCVHDSSSHFQHFKKHHVPAMVRTPSDVSSNRKAVPANRMAALAFLSPPRHTEGSAVPTVACHSNARAWGGGPRGIRVSAVCQALHAGAQRDVDPTAHWGICGECIKRQLRYVITIAVIVIML